jgi:hypothetical protein
LDMCLTFPKWSRPPTPHAEHRAQEAIQDVVTGHATIRRVIDHL